MNPVFTPDEPILEWRGWPPKWKSRRRLQWPKDFRKFMFWVFATTFVTCLADLLYTIPRHYKFSILRNILSGPIFSVHMAAISGVSAWAIWKAKSWARGWAIAASLMYVLIFLRQFIISIRAAWDHHLGVLFLGLLGLVSFAWRDEPVNSAQHDAQAPD